MRRRAVLRRAEIAPRAAREARAKAAQARRAASLAAEAVLKAPRSLVGAGAAEALRERAKLAKAAAERAEADAAQAKRVELDAQRAAETLLAAEAAGGGGASDAAVATEVEVEVVAGGVGGGGTLGLASTQAALRAMWQLLVVGDAKASDGLDSASGLGRMMPGRRIPGRRPGPHQSWPWRCDDVEEGRQGAAAVAMEERDPSHVFVPPLAHAEMCGGAGGTPPATPPGATGGVVDKRRPPPRARPPKGGGKGPRIGPLPSDEGRPRTTGHTLPGGRRSEKDDEEQHEEDEDEGEARAAGWGGAAHVSAPQSGEARTRTGSARTGSARTGSPRTTRYNVAIASARGVDVLGSPGGSARSLGSGEGLEELRSSPTWPASCYSGIRSFPAQRRTQSPRPLLLLAGSLLEGPHAGGRGIKLRRSATSTDGGGEGADDDDPAPLASARGSGPPPRLMRAPKASPPPPGSSAPAAGAPPAPACSGDLQML